MFSSYRKTFAETKKAKCIRRTPFTLKLNYETSNYTQDLTFGMDTGSSKIGTAAVTNNGDVLYISEVEIRNDITEKMEQRSKYRRNRRNRKTRYRNPRWLNRRNSIKKNRFPPTVKSKIDSHLKEYNFVKSILPITKVIIETATFDTHAMKNPAVLKNKWLYQKGLNYGLANTKAYVLSRDSYTCQQCKKKNTKLEVHHIIFRNEGGSDEESNLITLCKTCHERIHKAEITLKKKGKKKGFLNHATQMNVIRNQILIKLPEAEETFGFVTKENRTFLGLSKEHFIDAIVIASQGNNVRLKTNRILYKKCISDGDFQQTKGVRSEQKIPTKKIYGFRKFDKVFYLGKEYFIKGRMTSGYAILMDIKAEKASLKPIPKFSKMKRLSARKTWIIQENHIASI